MHGREQRAHSCKASGSGGSALRLATASAKALASNKMKAPLKVDLWGSRSWEKGQPCYTTKFIRTPTDQGIEPR